MTIALIVLAAVVGLVEGHLIERLSVVPSTVVVAVTTAIVFGLYVAGSPEPGDRWWIVFAWYGLGVAAGLAGTALYRRRHGSPEPP